MRDVPPGDDEKRVPEEAAARDVQVAPDSRAPESSKPPNRRDLAAMLRAAEVTSIAPSPIRPNPDPAAAENQDAASHIPKPPSVVAAASALTSLPASQGAGGRANAFLLELGTVLAGRYEILQLVGQGGMGAVYQAADREVDRIVALKVIQPELAADAEMLARFKQELLLSSQVTHRNVIRIYDLGEAQGVKFITMEFIEGENLHQLLKRRGKLEVQEAVDIMQQVASGLGAAHREGIIHRDLKPANIMVDKQGRVVVMDFGLARRVAGEGMTKAGNMLGTIEYMSPEQAQGKEVQASSDIFTVGLILFELLAGSTPFHAENPIASLIMRTQQRAAALANVDKNIPGALSNIVSRCLEKDPAKRYQSAEHLEEDLRAWHGGSGARSIHASTWQLRPDRMWQLPWLRISVAGILVAAMAGGGIWWVIARRQAARLRSHGPISVLIGDFANHTGDSVLDNTLEPMLGVAMEGASFINVYSRGDARRLAQKLPHPTGILDEQSSRLVALNQDINAVITGDISLRGDQYDISAIALDTVSGNVLARADITANTKQEILSELPKLAVPLRKALGDTTPASLQFEKVSGGFTAASLEAVHQDALGVDEQFAGKFQEAFDSFQKSAALDPKFARAYTGMAAMAQNLGRPAEAARYMQLAMENKDRMTERELYRNEGLYYLTTGDWQKCVQQYTILVAHYPADRVGQNNLANCYTQLRNAPKALEAARRAVEIVPRGVGPRLNLAFISVFSGDFAAGEKEARAALAISPSASQAYLTLAEAELGQGKMQEAEASYRQMERFGAAAASTAADGLADLAAYQGNYAEATRILTQGATADRTGGMADKGARKYVTLANIEVLQGHAVPALAAIAKALAISQSTQIQFLAAGIYVEGGDTLKARKLGASLSSQTSIEPGAYGKIISGLIALKGNDTQAAIHQITAANGLLDTWIGHFELGRAYLQQGSYAEADAEFQQCIQRRGEAIELFDDNVPTYSYLPPVYAYQERARAAMKKR